VPPGAVADAGVVVAGPTNYKMVTVTIQRGVGERIIQLQAVVANYRISDD
jgi:hypothetical protein